VGPTQESLCTLVQMAAWGFWLGPGGKVSPESRAIGGELSKELVGAAHWIVGYEFQSELSVVSEGDLREIAIVLIELWPRDVAAKDSE
jgi:hypothetical protein